MSRSVTKLGPPPPDIRGRLTFDTGDWSNLENQFPLHSFPWNYVANTDGTPADTSQGEIAVELPKDDGTYAPAKLRRQYDGRRSIIINGESQTYCDPALLEQFSEPPLHAIVDGSLEMYSRRTPASMQDHCISGSAVDYRIIEADEAAGTITVEGKWWETKETSIDGTTYIRGQKYGGLGEHLNDDLTGQTVHFAHKRTSYDYGIMQVKVRGIGDRYVHYTAVESLDKDGNPITVAPRLDRIYNADTKQHENFYTGTQDKFEDNPTTHVLTIEPGMIEPGTWPSAGDAIKITYRLPYISKMFSTQTAFAQHYGVWDFEFRLDKHLRNFFAKFGWGDYVRVSSPSNGFKGINVPKTATDDSEIDDVENPTGGGKFRQFHNIHEFHSKSMRDHARTSGRQPVLIRPGDGGVKGEWTKPQTQQHQMAIDENSPEFVSYVDRYARLRRYWWPPGNPYGKPGNSTEWYIDISPANSGDFRRIGGALNPLTSGDGMPFAAKCTFLNAAVWGDFCRSNAVYPLAADTNDSPTLTHRIRHERVYQFTDREAGGGGVPDADGSRPRGFLPVPGDITGGSGTGIVQDADAETIAGGGNGQASTLQMADSAVTIEQGQGATLDFFTNADPATVSVTGSSSNPDSVRVTDSGSGSIFIETLFSGTSTVEVFVTNDQGVTTSETVVVTVEGGTPPSLNPPVVRVPDVQIQLDAGQTQDIPITVTDEKIDTVVMSASASASSVARIVSVTTEFVRVQGTGGGVSDIAVTATDSGGTSTTASFEVLVSGDTANLPPTIATPAGQSTIEAGESKDIPITVTDEDVSTVVMSASASATSVVRVVSVNTQVVRIEGIGVGVSDIAITATDNTGQATTASFEVRTTADTVTDPDPPDPPPDPPPADDPVNPQPPSITASRLADAIVRLQVTGTNAVVFEIRRDNQIIGRIRPPETTFDDTSAGQGVRTYAARAISSTGRASSDSTTSVNLAPDVVDTAGSILDVFAPRVTPSGAPAIDLSGITARISALESATSSPQDEPLLIFRSIAERDAYDHGYNGLRAATLTGDGWSIHDGTAWRPTGRETVMARVGGSQVYGTPSPDIAADQQAVAELLEFAPRVLRYASLTTYTIPN